MEGVMLLFKNKLKQSLNLHLNYCTHTYVIMETDNPKYLIYMYLS